MPDRDAGGCSIACRAVCDLSGQLSGAGWAEVDGGLLDGAPRALHSSGLLPCGLAARTRKFVIGRNVLCRWTVSPSMIAESPSASPNGRVKGLHPSLAV